jgi:hypothetical protein
MYNTHDESVIRAGLRLGLGSQGIWTPELEDIVLKEILEQYRQKYDELSRIIDKALDDTMSF